MDADMTPDPNLRRHFKTSYVKAVDAAQILRDLSKDWLDRLQLRVRLQLRLEWLRAMGGERVEPSTLDSLIAQFRQAWLESGEGSLLSTIEALRVECLNLEAAIEAATERLPDFAPADPQSGATYSKEQHALLHLALIHEPIRYDAANLPNLPFASGTGIARKSDILYLAVSTGAGPAHVAAKFDDPVRSESEWKQIDRLRQLDLPPAFILPLPSSQRGDGVILSLTATNEGSSRPCATFLEYLTRCLPHNPVVCGDFLALALHELSALHRHETGQFYTPSHESRRWRHFEMVQQVRSNWVDTEIRQGDELVKQIGIVTKALSMEGWSAADGLPEEVPALRTSGTILSNPLRRRIGTDSKEDIIEDIVGRLHLSRIHNDLNLTNLLVEEGRDCSPVGASIIDLARSRPEQPTAFDFARLEVEICLWLFGKEALEGSTDADKERFFLDCLDRIDGRTKKLPEGTPAIVANGSILLLRLRHLADKALRSPDEPRYIMDDYFRCLYFTYLWKLRHLDEAGSIRLALFGAAASLQMLEDTQRGQYAAKGGRPCPWRSGRSRPPRGDVAG